MITKTNKGHKVQSNIEGDRIALSFDEKSLTHLMNVIIDLYSDSEMAIIREYSTNALDAHIAVGNTDPIRVFLPTRFIPSFRIQDYGVGLSLEDIINIYSKYGASTKRETNDQVGMLGLGCKSALTYTSQFTLSSVKDGMKIVASVSRNQEGAAEILIVEHFESDEPSGTLITIPVKPYNNLVEKAAFFFSFWKKGTVLVDGKEPESFKESSKIKDNIFVIEKTNHNLSLYPRDVIVMGNVPYPVTFQARDILFRQSRYSAANENLRFAVFVDIGEVEFVPSRESLTQTKETTQIIEKYNAEILELFYESLQKQIDEAETHNDAIRIAYGLAEKYGIVFPSSPTYKGEVIPSKFRKEDLGYDKDDTLITINLDHYGTWDEFYYWYGSHVAPSTYYGGQRYRPLLKTFIFVKNYSIKYTGYHKAKINLALKNAGITDYNKNVLCGKGVPNCKWLPKNIVILDWEEVRKLKPESSGSQKKVVGSFKGYIDTAFVKEISSEDFGENLFYVASRTWFPIKDIVEADLLERKNPKEPFYIIEVPDNRKDKFLRDFPHAQDMRKSIEEGYKKTIAKLTEDDKVALVLFSQNSDIESFQRSCDFTQIKDPALKKIEKIDFKAIRILLNKFEHYRRYIYTADWRVDVKATSPFSEYPLFSTHYMLNHPEQIYIYLNAAYAARKKSQKT